MMAYPIILAKSIPNYPDEVKILPKFFEENGMDLGGIELLMKPESVTDALENPSDFSERLGLENLSVIQLETGDRLRDGVPVDPLSANPEARQESRDYIRNTLKFLKELRATNLTVHMVGYCTVLKADNIHMPVQLDVSPTDKDYYRHLEEFKEFHDTLGKLGNFISYENVFPMDFQGENSVSWHQIGNSLTDFEQINVPMTYDTGHHPTALSTFLEAKACGGFVMSEEGTFPVYIPPRERAFLEENSGKGLQELMMMQLEKLETNIDNVHLTNWRGSYADRQHSSPKGLLDLKPIIREVASRNPDAVFVAEVTELDHKGKYMKPVNQLAIAKEVTEALA